MIDLSQLVLAVVFACISWALAFLTNRKLVRFAKLPSVFAFDGNTVLATSSRTKAIFGHAMSTTLLYVMLVAMQTAGVDLFSNMMGLAGIITLALQMNVYGAMITWAKNQPQTT